MTSPALPRPAAMTLLAVCLTGALACGSGETPDASSGEAPDAATGEPARSSAETPSPTPDTPTDEAPGVPGTPPRETPAGSAASGSPERPDSTPSPALPDWSETEWAGGAAGATGTQVDLRTGRHEGFDRVVLVFSDHVPGYTVGYAGDRPRQCGSGRPVEVSAPAYVTIDLEPARAHNQRGKPTVTERTREPGLPIVAAASLFCDFEGQVEWVLGVERRAPLRVFELGSPARLVVDLRH